MKQSNQPAVALRLASHIQSAEQDDIQKKKLSRSKLINSLNRINFNDGEITLRFKHNKYRSFITLPAKPQACHNSNLKCQWPDTVQNLNQLQFYIFDNFTFSDGLSQVYVPAECLDYNEEEISLELPENAYETYRREIKRFDCRGVSAQMSQDGWFANGVLENFAAQSFAVTFDNKSSQLTNDFDSNNQLHLVLKRDNEFIFSGSCSILRTTETDAQTTLILKPLSENVHRVKSKLNRSDRLVLKPLPTIEFLHPIIQKKFNLGLTDISGAGFSVEEDCANAVLLPGMVISELQIQFMHGFSIQCKCQVLYRQVSKDTVKCGFVILDMEMNDYLKLSSLIHQARNKHSLISSTSVDLDALWEFFFETGFIYPEKYIHISEQKDQFKKLYKKLYNESPEIARHVIYQDKGKIYGHVSMFRYYRNTWLMQHHAAVRSSKHKAGLVVMEHILQFINEFHNIPSAQMKYIACYFRQNNRFAYRVFGGAARSLEDQQKCSLDNFAYFHFARSEEKNKLEKHWTIAESDQDDLHLFNQWYKQNSGGLMIDGLDLGSNAADLDDKTNLEYKNAGFKRSRKIYSLKKNDELLAVFVLNNSDMGMNMSDLTNCIKAMVIDPAQVSKDRFFTALSQLSTQYKREEIPVLLYPDSYAADQDISYDKTYILTVLDLSHISPYLQFMKSLTLPKVHNIAHIAASSNS